MSANYSDLPYKGANMERGNRQLITFLLMTAFMTLVWLELPSLRGTVNALQGTSVATSIATRAAASGSFGLGDPVKGDEWALIVESVEKMGKHVESPGMNVNRRVVITAPEGQHLLRVTIILSRLNGERIGSGFIQKEINVRDQAGKSYPYFAAGFQNLYFPLSTLESEGFMVPVRPNAQINYLFVVPDTATIVDFVWSNLPAVRLEKTAAAPPSAAATSSGAGTSSEVIQAFKSFFEAVYSGQEEKALSLTCEAAKDKTQEMLKQAKTDKVTKADLSKTKIALTNQNNDSAEIRISGFIDFTIEAQVVSLDITGGNIALMKNENGWKYCGEKQP
jgi:hypothetical protein